MVEVEAVVRDDLFNNIEYRGLIEFISKELSIKRTKIQPDSKLENDLGVYGDEMSDFLILYSKKYNVDLSEFAFDKYFSDEGDKISQALLIWLGMKKKPKDLTVYDLYTGIKNGFLK